MRTVKRLLTFLLAVVFAFGISYATFTVSEQEPVSAGVSSAASTELAIHRSYREASDIVLATCSLQYRSASGNAVSRFTVDKVYDGTLSVGDSITLSGGAKVGESYLLYLGQGGGADYAEDEAGFVSVTDQLISVRGDTAYCGGESYSLSSIIDDLSEQRSVLTIPAQSFYYNDLTELINACDDVVLCRVIGVEGPYSTRCRSNEKGETVLSTVEQTFLTLKVENGFGGEHSYGDRLRVAISPEHMQSVINAGDLSSVHFGSPIKMPEEGGDYLFFLLHSEDAKSDCCFAVNPYQGCIELDGDRLIRPYYNTAFIGIVSLDEFAGLLARIQGFED